MKVLEEQALVALLVA